MAGSLGLAAAFSGAAVAWVVPTYRNARPVWRFVEQHATGTGEVLRAERITRFPKGWLGVYTADNDVSLRGEAFDLVIIDEAAQIRSETWTDVVLPTLADRDGKALLISTPKGLNWFYDEFQRGLSDGREQASFHAPSSANPMPTIQRAARLAKERVSERTYRQEWLAEFVTDGAYFTQVDECATLAEPDRPDQHAGHAVFMGIDWGIANDYTVLALYCPACNRMVDWRSMNGGTFIQQRATIAEYARRWKVSGILPERNSIGEPNLELLWADGLPILKGADHKPGFFTSAATKAGLIERLKLALEKDHVLVPRAFAAELRAYEITARDGQPPKFGAPDGAHDDQVIALALALQAAVSRIGFSEF